MVQSRSVVNWSVAGPRSNLGPSVSARGGEIRHTLCRDGAIHVVARLVHTRCGEMVPPKVDKSMMCAKLCEPRWVSKGIEPRGGTREF